jgi:hypothetical protein
MYEDVTYGDVSSLYRDHRAGLSTNAGSVLTSLRYNLGSYVLLMTVPKMELLRAWTT